MGPRGYIRRIHEYWRIGCERWDYTTRVPHVDAVKRRKEWGDEKSLVERLRMNLQRRLDPGAGLVEGGGLHGD